MLFRSHRQWSEVVGRFEWLPDGVDTLRNRSNLMHVLRGWVVYADAVAAAHGTTQSAVALAWLCARPTVVASIASARSVEQLHEWLGAAELTLSSSELDALSRAG